MYEEGVITKTPIAEVTVYKNFFDDIPIDEVKNAILREIEDEKIPEITIETSPDSAINVSTLFKSITILKHILFDNRGEWIPLIQEPIYSAIEKICNLVNDIEKEISDTKKSEKEILKYVTNKLIDINEIASLQYKNTSNRPTITKLHGFFYLTLLISRYIKLKTIPAMIKELQTTSSVEVPIQVNMIADPKIAPPTEAQSGEASIKVKKPKVEPTELSPVDKDTYENKIKGYFNLNYEMVRDTYKTEYDKLFLGDLVQGDKIPFNLETFIEDISKLMLEKEAEVKVVIGKGLFDYLEHSDRNFQEYQGNMNCIIPVGLPGSFLKI